MKQKIIGGYFCGYESVKLILKEGFGGEFFFVEEGKIARIKIGGDQSWDDCFTVLIHEIFEFVSDRIKCRFAPCNDMSKSTGSIDGCLPDLKKVYRVWNKKEKK